MFIAINDTKRCSLFQEISTNVWNKIINAHAVGVDLPEIGITADILVSILDYHKRGIQNFDVFAKPGWKENIYGSDLDIFIETKKDEYKWFAFQAKILKLRNRYTTLRESNGGEYQWQKLERLQQNTGCMSFYLFYNGKSDYFNKISSCRSQVLSENQFGCSIVSVDEVQKLALKKNSRTGRYDNPSFEDFHPVSAKPWSELTCCYLKTDGPQYSYEEIISASRRFEKLGLEEELDNDLNDIQGNQLGGDNDNRIATGADSSGWDPDLRIVISRTDSSI